MNVVEFKETNELIAFCFIDNTSRYSSAWTREIIKNIADYTISNLHGKCYSVYQSENEDLCLKKVAELGYKHAVVFSTGTEFINGENFFSEINKLIDTDFWIYGHILDRGDAYYELHHQCYLINLDRYRSLGFPEVGQVDLGNVHNQSIPYRSLENIHDDYTPLWVGPGNIENTYSHRLHGWNIISKVLDSGGTICAFNDSVRSNKKYYYPENQTEFLKHISWAHTRYHYCANDFVHTQNTEVIESIDTDYQQIITPASGDWFKNYVGTQPVTVVYYDYNQKSLDYWKIYAPAIDNVTYKFVKIDLLGIYDPQDLITDTNKKTLINLSNIFCYEGTAAFCSLEYRLQKEKEVCSKIPKNWTTTIIISSVRGFIEQRTDIKITQLTKPTWHFGGDWNE